MQRAVAMKSAPLKLEGATAKTAFYAWDGMGSINLSA